MTERGELGMLTLLSSVVPGDFPSHIIYLSVPYYIKGVLDSFSLIFIRVSECQVLTSWIFFKQKSLAGLLWCLWA